MDIGGKWWSIIIISIVCVYVCELYIYLKW